MNRKMKYDFFTTNEIKPTGWLKEQLLLQAKGLNGNLDKIWPDVKDSGWIGGERDGWERVPYWLDGFIPLAYLLENEDMIARAKKYIDAIIEAQDSDGWICPCTKSQRENYDTWAVLLILKVLTVYADCSGDDRVQNVVELCLKNFDKHLDYFTLRNWGAARWFEGLIAILWLYERTNEEWLLNLARKLKALGFDWKEIFESGYVDSCTEGWDFYSHVVNIAMMLKSEALMSLISDGDPESFAKEALEYLMTKHGMATGHFTGDETLSGCLPIKGSELCGVVEAMYSYEWLFAITGNTEWLDWLEKLAFNALPATISPDMWSHQYVQMTNQVAAFPMSKPPFRTNNYVAHTFGLEPNFGCCTANFGQGWPKFALTSFMKTENGIASCAITPASIKTEINNVDVYCESETQYPFRDTVTYKITTSAPVTFTMSIRIPSFADSAEINGENVETGGFVNITKEWSGTETINVKLHFSPSIIQRPDDMVCVWRGPLLYSIAIDEKWERVEYICGGVERKFPYCDYYIYPTSKWNYALADDTFEVKENDVVSGFGGDEPPVEMTAKMFEVEWEFANGYCSPKPKSLKPISTIQNVQLIPYGCTNLRMTEIPYIKTADAD
ncbi:MAG: hypothetical protein EGR16_00835 [Clostridiales bacterium]|nr:hypothetical protein [Clostridiales bacterium]